MRVEVVGNGYLFFLHAERWQWILDFRFLIFDFRFVIPRLCALDAAGPLPNANLKSKIKNLKSKIGLDRSIRGDYIDPVDHIGQATTPIRSHPYISSYISEQHWITQQIEKRIEAPQQLVKS